MKLSKSFSLEEFTTSQAAARMGRQVVVPADLYPNLVRLAQDVLQPLRDAIGRPMVILSGYRPGWLNVEVGGSKTSEHCDARAADIFVPGVPVIEICRRIQAMRLPFNELIYEFGSWAHVSVPPDGLKPRGEIWTARKVAGRTKYLDGIQE